MYLDKYILSLITEACLLCLTKNYKTRRMMLIINSLILGYTDRRRNNDNESTTFDAQETNGN